jgi:hypothetical protein
MTKKAIQREFIGLVLTTGLAVGCGTGTMLIRQPVVMACESRHLKGCDKLTDGVLAYVDGDKQAAEDKILEGVRANEPKQILAFADALDHIAVQFNMTDLHAVIELLKAGSKKAEPAVASLRVTPLLVPPPPSTTSPSNPLPVDVAFLNINSIPVSAALLDGKPIGGTPKLKFPVSAGVHSVLFINADQNFKEQISVTVAAGETKDATWGGALPEEPIGPTPAPHTDDSACVQSKADQVSPTEILVCTNDKCDTSVAASYAMLCISSQTAGAPGATVTCHKWSHSTSSSSPRTLKP